MDVKLVRNNLAFTCDPLTWFLREESLLPTLGAEPAAASAPAPRHIPEHAVSLSPGHGAAAVPALHPGLAGCRRRRGAPAQEQAVLTPAPLHGSDAAEVPGRCCGFIQLTAAATQERACTPRSLPCAGWSWRAVRVRSKLSQQGWSWLTRGREHEAVTPGPAGLPASERPRAPGAPAPGVHLRGPRGACARGRFSAA